MNDSDLLDDGIYIGTVVKSEIIDSEYMVHKEWNPNGTCLNLWIDVDYEDGDGSKRLFTRLNKTQANKLFESYNKPTVEDLNDAKPEFLNKKSVFVETQQYTSKVGKVSNIVKNVSPVLGEKNKSSSKREIPVEF